MTRILGLPWEYVAEIIARRPSWTRSSLESVKEYRPVPKEGDRVGSPVWRLALGDLGTECDALGLEVWGDAILGRNGEADVDFSPYDANELGVSRRHAMIRPTPSGLFLIDLGSTNGTLCNFVPLGPGEAYRLSEGDVVLLGRMYFSVMGVSPVT